MAGYFADLGVAAYDLQPQGQSWILSGIYIEFGDELPYWRSTVISEIWEEAMMGDEITCSCFRDEKQSEFYHQLFNQSGDDVALMNSSWKTS